MNKDWEEQFKKELESYNWKGMAKAYEKQKIEWNAKNWEKFVKEIRTQLLARVREEVISIDLLNFCSAHREPEKDCDICGVNWRINLYRKEQLKKLEIISEEVK